MASTLLKIVCQKLRVVIFTVGHQKCHQYAVPLRDFMSTVNLPPGRETFVKRATTEADNGI